MSKDLLIWVGRSYYDKANFISEASTIGACRRVPCVPDIEVGKSRCFLVISDLLRVGHESEERPHIFAYFTIKAIGYVVDGNKDVPKELAERGVKPMNVSGPSAMPVRGCGLLEFGATYILSHEDFEKVKDMADGSDLEGNLNLIEPGIPYDGVQFRGFRYVDGDEILRGHETAPVPRIRHRWPHRQKTLGSWEV